MNDVDRTGWGLTVSVYRDAELGDCSNNGISARHSQLTIVGIIDETVDRVIVQPVPEGSRVFAPTADRPAVWLVKQSVFGSVSWYIRPADHVNRRPMMGGNFAYSSDSRFVWLHGIHGALKIHDRYES